VSIGGHGLGDTGRKRKNKVWADGSTARPRPLCLTSISRQLEAGLSGSRLAAALTLAGILAFAALVTGLAAALTLAIILAFTVMGSAVQLLDFGARDNLGLGGREGLRGSAGLLGRAGQESAESGDGEHSRGRTDQLGLLIHSILWLIRVCENRPLKLLAPWRTPGRLGEKMKTKSVLNKINSGHDTSAHHTSFR
jgi:hypothetical protein